MTIERERIVSDNEKQREYWNGPVGQNWAERYEAFERGFVDITAEALKFADLKPGMAVLDIGCGAGVTTAEIARRVAPGKAVGVDISAPLTAVARRRFGDLATFLEADAANHPFQPEFDLVFSRFGVMFFADPVKAFANIRTALKPGGRLAIVCWCPFEEIPLLYDTYAAAEDLLPPREPPPPLAPGPFGLSDHKSARTVLADAGYRDIVFGKSAPRSLMGTTLEEAVEQALNLGPLAHATRDMDDAAKDKVRTRIRPVLARHKTEDGIAPPVACWLVGAKA